MAGKLFMYNGEQQQFVERGYGIMKINESHDPADWDRLQARLSRSSFRKQNTFRYAIFVRSYETR